MIMRIFILMFLCIFDAGKQWKEDEEEKSVETF